MFLPCDICHIFDTVLIHLCCLHDKLSNYVDTEVV
jgi:hypothetical protein